ncbi:sigma 54-interacting transcriptional regulator [Paraliomyxa miuraensis]|nr:sigma 54-interacting transcriptional regulator [Paraliomyxa miuraensis]
MSKPVLQVLQSTVRQPPPPAILVRRPGQLRLRITGGSASPRAETFTKDRIICGRSVVNDIVLDDPSLSGTHFSLKLVQDGVRVMDRSSTNGTWFCGGRVSELMLSAGMSFTAGAYRFEILGTDSVEVPVLTASEFHGMHGESAVMREVFARLSRLALTDLDLFVEGETGTGKEMVARALHAASPRSHLPFAVLDCAWLTRNLAEEEIFGHVKGAYTQAHDAAPGCFEVANGGTLFIDEIGELPIDLQPRLLRVLDRREVQRLGERKPRKVDVRVVAATNRDLRQMVADGQFREDLYFRLIEESIRLPPLRERDGDANHLADVLLTKLSQEVGREHSLTGEAREAVKRYGWPGNVRELYKVLRRASRLVQSPEIGPGDLRLGSVHASEREMGCFELPFSEFETEYFKRLMADSGGNLSEAARRSGFSRKALRERLKRHGVYEGAAGDES